jgi:hypothetical protein
VFVFADLRKRNERARQQLIAGGLNAVSGRTRLSALFKSSKLPDSSSRPVPCPETVRPRLDASSSVPLRFAVTYSTLYEMEGTHNATCCQSYVVRRQDPPLHALQEDNEVTR